MYCFNLNLCYQIESWEFRRSVTNFVIVLGYVFQGTDFFPFLFDFTHIRITYILFLLCSTHFVNICFE